MLLDEAMAFLHRNLPISGRFEPGKLERVDELLFPTAALREALVNALCHRDYSITGGSINVAVFDDRVEIWSVGTLPNGLHAEDLKKKHISQPRNHLITDTFFRRGLIEQWGRGTQKIIELCKKAGHPEPEFTEVAGSVVVTFRPAAGHITPQVATQDNNLSDSSLCDISTALSISMPQVTAQVTAQVANLLKAVKVDAKSREYLQSAAGLANREHFRKFYIEPLIESGWIERTIPKKPKSRLQKYRITEKGRAWLAQRSGNDLSGQH